MKWRRFTLGRWREAILEKDSRVHGLIRDRLAEGWSPEQISGWLKKKNELALRGKLTDQFGTIPSSGMRDVY